jgi:hypothetical protein
VREEVKKYLEHERVFIRFFKSIKVARKVISRMIKKAEKKK